MTGTESSLGTHFLEIVSQELSRIKVRAEKAIAQVADDRRLHVKLDAESNSIAVIVTHLSGPTCSRAGPTSSPRTARSRAGTATRSSSRRRP